MIAAARRRPRLAASVAAGLAVVLVAVGVAASASGSGGPGPPRTTDGAAPEAAAGRADARDRATSTTTTSTTTTTTMPPRAEPALLGPTERGPLQGALIVVDPGHNGANFAHVDVRRPAPPGTEGPLCNSAGTATGSLREVDVNWAIGTRLATLLRRLGAAVLLTHADNDGFGPCADERGRQAATAGADLLVSIHADGADGGSGFHVIHPAPRPESGPGLGPESVARSAALARRMRDELLVVGGRPSNYVGTRGTQERSDLATLNHAVVPAVLAELGNLRHPLDATLLADDTSQDVLARALARAVVAVLGHPPDPRIAPDGDGDGRIDLLVGAPEWLLPSTSTTTSTTVVVVVDPTTTVPPVTTPSSEPETTATTGPP